MAIQFPGIEGSILVRIRCVETLLYDSKVFIPRQGAVVIRVGSGELLGTQPSRQLAPVERTFMFAVDFANKADAAFLTSARSNVPSLSVSNSRIGLARARAWPRLQPLAAREALR